jgi:hypothetical protein
MGAARWGLTIILCLMWTAVAVGNGWIEAEA